MQQVVGGCQRRLPPQSLIQGLLDLVHHQNSAALSFLEKGCQKLRFFIPTHVFPSASPVLAIVGDRGFDSHSNVAWLNAQKIYNAICPRSPSQLRERMQEHRFSGLQNRRSQTEGRIGILKNQFLGRPLRVKGFAHRELFVGHRSSSSNRKTAKSSLIQSFSAVIIQTTR
jgi:hypothetical protein